MCSPSWLGGGPPLKSPRDLTNHTLVHIEWSRQGVTWPNWRMWMAAAGVEDFDDSRTVVFGTSSDAIQAALDGTAVALADFAMVAYFLVYPLETAADPRIVAFRDWLIEEAAKPPS